VEHREFEVEDLCIISKNREREREKVIEEEEEEEVWFVRIVTEFWRERDLPHKLVVRSLFCKMFNFVFVKNDF
jgi:hypothetical protein